MKVPVRLAGRLIAIPAEWEPILGRCCRYMHLTPERERGETTIVTEERALYTIVGKEMVIMRGLMYRMEQELAKHGHSFEVIEDCEPFRDVFEPDFKAVGDTNWRHRQFDSFLLPALHADGLIDAVTAFGKSFLTSKICLAYRKANILVVVPGIGLSGDMFDMLKKALGSKKVGRYGGHPSKDRKLRRVVVSTPESIHHIPDDWPDMVIYDEVHTSASDDRARKLMAFNKAKMFGLTGTSDGRGDNAEMRYEAIFGPRRIAISYEEALEHGLVARITYRMLTINQGVKASAYRMDVDKFRYPIWKNEHRNLALAKAMVEYMKANPGEQALFSVDKTEHALYVQQAFKMLGVNIPVICGSFDEDRAKSLRKHGALTDESWIISLPSEIKRYRNDFCDKRELYAIATSIFSTGADFRHLRFLVFGSGSSAKIAQKQWVGRAMRLGDQNPDEARSLVIDTFDTFCRTCRSRSEKRRLVARKEGWIVEEVFPGV